MPIVATDLKPGQRVIVRPKLPLLVRLVWWLLKPARRLARVLRRLAGVGLVVALLAGWRLLRAATVGRWRWQCAPVWAALAASVVAGWSWWAWSTAAAATWMAPDVHALRARRRALRGRPAPRRRLSARESRLVAGTFAMVATWHLLVQVVPGMADLPWWLPGSVVLSVAPWWWLGRRVAPPAAVPAIVAQWREAITDKEATRASHLAGTVLVDWSDVVDTATGPQGDAVLELPHGTVPSKVTNLDELAEHLLDRPAGTVQIGRHPSMSQRTVRVRFSPAGTSSVVRYFQEPTYDPATGLFLAGYAHETAPVHAAFNRDGGAMHWALVGATGTGKGGVERLIATEAALSPLILGIFLDGKRGTGCPSIRDGMAYYARTPEQWRDAIFAVERMLEARMELYGEIGRDRFTPGWRHGEPLIWTFRDEWHTIHQTWPSLVGKAARSSREGRSLGFADGFAHQKGDAYSWGDVAIRNNVYGNGTLWLGAAGDAAAAGVAVQTYGVDINTMPGAPGWGAWLSKVDGTASGDKARGLFLPSQSDVDDGKPAPFGRAEDWAQEAARAGTVFPALHPALQAILDQLVHSDPALSADAADANADAEREAKASALERILAHLASLPDGTGLHRGELAGIADISAGHASTVLDGAKTEGLVDQARKYGPYTITDAGRERALEVAPK